MIPVTAFAGKGRAVRPRFRGRERERAARRRRDVVASTTPRTASQERTPPFDRRSASHRLGRIAVDPRPGVPLTHPAPHWSVECRRGGDRRHRTVLPRAAQTAPDTPFVAITGTNGNPPPRRWSRICSRARSTTQLGGNIGTAILSLNAAGACAGSSARRSRSTLRFARSVRRHPAQRRGRSSTATAHCAITRRSRSGWWPACSATVPRSSASTTTGARLWPIGSAAPASASCGCTAPAVRRALRQAACGRRHRARWCTLAASVAARRAQCAERRLRHRRGAGARPVAETIQKGLVSFLASCTAWSRSRASAMCCPSTTPRRPMRRGGARLRVSPTFSGSRRQGEPAHYLARRIFSAHRQGLSDRRGGGRVRRYAARQGAHIVAGTLERSRARRRMPRPRSKDPSCCSPACASYDQYRNFRSAARRSVRR